MDNTNQVSPRVCTGQQIQMGQLTELNLKQDDFNSWIERFELYVSLNKMFVIFNIVGK